MAPKTKPTASAASTRKLRPSKGVASEVKTQTDLLGFFSALKPSAASAFEAGKTELKTTGTTTPTTTSGLSSKFTFASEAPLSARSPIHPPKKLRLNQSVEPIIVVKSAASIRYTPNKGENISANTPINSCTPSLPTKSVATSIRKRKAHEFDESDSSDNELSLNSAARNNAARSLEATRQNSARTPSKKVFTTPTPQNTPSSKTQPISASKVSPTSPSKSSALIVAKPATSNLLSSHPQKQNSGKKTAKINSIESKTEPHFPSHILLLRRFFKSLESVLAFHTSSRDTAPTFHKLRKPVENITGREFTLTHLSQIIALVPKLYRLTPVRVRVDESTEKTENSMILEMADDECEDGSLLAKVFKEVLNRRAYVFENACIEYVRSEYRLYLEGVESFGDDKDEFKAKINVENESKSIEDRGEMKQRTEENLGEKLAEMPIVTKEKEGERKWMAKFDVETYVREIVGIVLPTVYDIRDAKLKLGNKADVEKLSQSTGDVASTRTGKDGTSIDKSFNTASVNLNSNKDIKLPDASAATSDVSPSNAAVTDTVQSLNEVAESSESAPAQPISRAAALLETKKKKEKIRAKERVKKESQKNIPTYSVEEMKRRSMITRLVEVGRGLMCFFNQKKKSTLSMKEVCDYTITAVKNSISYHEAKEHILLLAQECPEIVTVNDLQVGTVVDFNNGIPNITAKIREKVKELMEKSARDACAAATAAAGNSTTLVKANEK
ncbi:hypothetical protein HK100_000758 [Physocladia obscura]|uniref:CDT1 Geminin-binding domain-containing protein n=1 Tax=Physocladia obscura TaxID=109957 RepID=A0AAD5SZG3_9FUNG|nr:hypothetical protein HK100_000758 [Physocladia obscura]